MELWILEFFQTFNRILKISAIEFMPQTLQSFSAIVFSVYTIVELFKIILDFIIFFHISSSFSKNFMFSSFPLKFELNKTEWMQTNLLKKCDFAANLSEFSRKIQSNWPKHLIRMFAVDCGIRCYLFWWFMLELLGCWLWWRRKVV